MGIEWGQWPHFFISRYSRYDVRYLRSQYGLHNLGLMHQQCVRSGQYGASATHWRGLCKIPRYRSLTSPLDVGGLNINPLLAMSGIFAVFSMEFE